MRETNPLFITLTALTSVLLWSLKPVMLTLSSTRIGHIELFFISSGIAIIFSLLLFLIWRKSVFSLVFSGGLRPIVYTVISGVCLAVWYYCFYRSIYFSQKIDATIIAFTWPLIAIVAIKIFYTEKSMPLLLHEWALILISFAGAVSIAIGGGYHTLSSYNLEIIFAFLAALGSGLYLPFSLKAIDSWKPFSNNSILPTAITISIGNIISFITVLLITKIFGFRLWFHYIDHQIIIIGMIIGIGIYIVAEIAWVWAFSKYENLTLSSLVYLSPVFSVIYLNVFFNEPISVLSAYGLILVAFSNLSLHSKYQFGNSTFASIICTLFVGLALNFTIPYDNEFLTKAAAFVGALFAIISGFILSRAHDRFRKENEQKMKIGANLHQLTRILNSQSSIFKLIVNKCDKIFQTVIDIEYERAIKYKNIYINNIYNELDLLDHTLSNTSEKSKSLVILDQIRESFERWLTIVNERLSLGEKVAIWSLCILSIVLVILIRDEGLISYIVVLVYSFGALLIAFAVRDYDSNRAFSNFTAFIVVQSFFKRIERPYYLPKILIDTKDFPTPHKPEKVRYKTTKNSEPIAECNIERPKGIFPLLYYTAFAGLIFCLVMLPASRNQDSNMTHSIAKRFDFDPGGYITIGKDNLITIGELNWDAAKANAYILSEIITKYFNVDVKVKKGNSDEIFRGMNRGDGSFDIHPDFWKNNQIYNYNTYIKNKRTVLINNNGYMASQGMYVPSYLSNEHNIKKISDLSQPNVISLFDYDNIGKGYYWPGSREWKSTNIWRVKFKSYKLDQYYQTIDISETPLKKLLIDKMAKKEPILFYYWEPDYMHLVAKLVRLEEPPFTGYKRENMKHHPDFDPDGCFEMYYPNETKDWLELSTITCRSPDVVVYVAFSKSLQKRFPEISRFLKRYSPTIQHVNDWIYQIGYLNVDSKEMAQIWSRDNKEIIEKWLKEDDRQ